MLKKCCKFIKAFWNKIIIKLKKKKDIKTLRVELPKYKGIFGKVSTVSLVLAIHVAIGVYVLFK